MRFQAKLVEGSLRVSFPELLLCFFLSSSSLDFYKWGTRPFFVLEPFTVDPAAVVIKDSPCDCDEKCWCGWGFNLDSGSDDLESYLNLARGIDPLTSFLYSGEIKEVLRRWYFSTVDALGSMAPLLFELHDVASQLKKYRKPATLDPTPGYSSITYTCEYLTPPTFTIGEAIQRARSLSPLLISCPTLPFKI